MQKTSSTSAQYLLHEVTFNSKSLNLESLFGYILNKDDNDYDPDLAFMIIFLRKYSKHIIQIDYLKETSEFRVKLIYSSKEIDDFSKIERLFPQT